MIEQKNVEKYAFYQIDKKDYYQYRSEEHTSELQSP